MLLVFIKSVVTFVLIFFVVRLMGKRQLGEMQPFELVITLIIAEVACIPMNDPYIPFYYGVVPIVTLSFLQILFSFLSEKFLPVRRLISGRSVTVIDKEGICYENLKKTLSKEEYENHPARYALVEIVNLHDDSLEFEAIHRVIFNVDAKNFFNEMEKFYDVSYEKVDNAQHFTYITNGKPTYRKRKRYIKYEIWT